MIPSNPLPSKPRYEILDGLRGVAAAFFRVTFAAFPSFTIRNGAPRPLTAGTACGKTKTKRHINR